MPSWNRGIRGIHLMSQSWPIYMVPLDKKSMKSHSNCSIYSSLSKALCSVRSLMMLKHTSSISKISPSWNQGLSATKDIFRDLSRPLLNTGKPFFLSLWKTCSILKASPWCVYATPRRRNFLSRFFFFFGASRGPDSWKRCAKVWAKKRDARAGYGTCSIATGLRFPMRRT